MSLSPVTAPVITCALCPATFAGTRSEARRAIPHWEPYSNATSWAINEGPMVCPTCIMRTLDELLDALRAHFHRYPNLDIEG